MKIDLQSDITTEMVENIYTKIYVITKKDGTAALKVEVSINKYSHNGEVYVSASILNQFKFGGYSKIINDYIKKGINKYCSDNKIILSSKPKKSLYGSYSAKVKSIG